MRKITDIYAEYKIMPPLQMHMLRVGAVAKLICDNFPEPLPAHDIVSAALLHDMGNIIKFKLDVFPQFLEPLGLAYWENVKEEYVQKYGEDEHEATKQIAEELQVSDEVKHFIHAVSFLGAPLAAASNNFGEKIVEYGDSRVTPFGVHTLEERLQDLRERYAYRGGDTPERLAYEKAVRDMETQIFAKCRIQPEHITDLVVAPIIEELKNFVIK